jgi:flavin reductase (DIM6/NTAB) family NADH-FMN oxidoreductase RutF
MQLIQNILFMSKLAQKYTYDYHILTALKKAGNLKTRDKDYMAAGTVNWVSQVSFSPIILSVAVGQKSDLNETIDYSGHFTLHLLSSDHEDYVKTFEKKSTIKDDTINGVPFKKINNQVIIEDTLGYATCRVVNSMNVGDHTIYFGEVVDENMLKDKKALNTMQMPIEYTKDKAEV